MKDKMNPLKDFIKVQFKDETWKSYREIIVESYKKLKDEFESSGFIFSETVTFDDFVKLKDKYHVNIIFSHCKSDDQNEAIEFFDRLVFADEFLNSIPPDYTKVIDLSVCKPLLIAEELKEKRRNSIRKYSEINIDGQRWLFVYREIFRVIKANLSPFYANAIEIALSNLYFKTENLLPINN